MSGLPLTIRAVGQMFGLRLPEPGRKKAKCPFRKHARDPAFGVYVSRSGKDEMWKCQSCDPPNTGGAVALYARLAGVDNKEAWKKLKDEGYDVGESKGGGARGPQDDREVSDRRAYEEEAKKSAWAVPIRGVQPKKALPLDPEIYAEWANLRTGALRRFAAERKIPEEALRALGMIDMPGGGAVGFTYYHPRTLTPCRVKVRTLGEKRFWMEPRPPEGETEAKALAPLYGSHDLDPALGYVIIVEGEIDALTLRYVGFRNVVSLPDGGDSAKSVSLLMLSEIPLRLVATDGDAAGDLAYRTLEARDYGAMNARVRWVRMKSEDEEPERHKDANDALKAGWVWEDFVRSLDDAVEATGYKCAWK